MSTENKITEGIIWKEMLFFFLPLLISAFFQHLYIMIDTIIIGRFLGDVELAAVGGSASKLITLLINFFVGLSSGITVYISRYFGAKNNDELKNSIVAGILICLVLGISLSLIGFIYSIELLELMDTPKDTVQAANIYLSTYFVGLIFCVLYNVFAGSLRAIGDAKTPLYLLIFCSILNIVLDLVFILLFNMGVFGAALATLLSQTVSAVCLAYILFVKIPKSTEKLKIRFSMLKNIVWIGLPTGLQSIMYSLSNIVVQTGINSVSTVAVTSWVAYVKIDSIVDIFVMALGSATIVFVSQNLGAGRFDRVKQSVKQAIILSYALVGSIVGLFILFREEMLSLFTTSQEVVQTGSNLMLVIIPMYLLTIPHQIFSQSLRGFGRSMLPMMLTLIGVVGVRFFWVYFIFPINNSIYLLGACYPAGAFIMSSIFTVYYWLVIRKETRDLI